MSVDTHLKLRGSVYYYRRRVPPELIEVIGKTEVVVSLGVKDLPTAKRKAREEYLRWEQRFDDERAKLRRAQGPLEEVTEEQARDLGQSLANEWMREVLHEDGAVTEVAVAAKLGLI